MFDAAGDVIGIQHEWSFDEAFSAWQIQGLDTDGDGTTSEAEMADLAAENIVGLAQYQFYTFAGEGAETLPFASMDNARMWNTDGRTVLSFGIEPQAPYHIKDKLEIAINDPEYYVAITFADASAITLQNAPRDCGVTLEPPEEMPPELADQLYALPPEVTELPSELAAALRGVQGAIVVSCGSAAAAPATAIDAINTATVSNALPFGGPPLEPGLNLPRTGFLGWIQEQQKSFYRAMNDALAALKTDNNAFWILGGLSFLYGVFHAAGPGHGKVVISSYVLANERQVRRGIWLSFLSAMLQSVVAVVFVLVAALLLNMTSLAMSNAANWIGIISYALVALLGLWLIARKVFGWGHSHAHEPAPSMQAVAHAHLHEPAVATAGGAGNLAFSTHDHHHDYAHDEHGHHHHGHAHDHHDHAHIVTPDQASGNWREQLAVVLSVGLRPCSGALVVLVFALSQNLLPAGIAAVFLMGLGVAITVGALAAIAVYAKGLAQRIGGVRAGLASAILWWLELAGAVAVFAFGMVLLLASI